MDRRQFLSQSATVGAGATLTLYGPFATRAFAAATADQRFVLLILRGGLDGLAAVPAYGEGRYSSLRGQLALAEPGRDGGVLALDGLFGLHPALTNMHTMYRAGELAVVHAVASPYRERSHFDGQKVLEAGGTSPSTSAGGWLNRALAALTEESFGRDAIALADTVPLVLRGPIAVSSWAPSRLPDTDEDTLARIRQIYAAADPELAAKLTDALNARGLAGAAGMDRGMRAGGRQLAPLTSAAARFLAADAGPRIAVIEAGGWDTHANQGAANGSLAAGLGQLDAGLHALRTELGSDWAKTTVVVVTEFGRTVAVNGTRGTDHGTGACAFVAGGAVAGGRIIADWPGLAGRDLYEGRDLMPTLDLRAIFKGVLSERYGLSARALDASVFPGSEAVVPLSLGRA
jgi:uncharacterized protein (DUF1501 family)